MNDDKAQRPTKLYLSEWYIYFISTFLLRTINHCVILYCAHFHDSFQLEPLQSFTHQCIPGLKYFNKVWAAEYLGQSLALTWFWSWCVNPFKPTIPTRFSDALLDCRIFRTRICTKLFLVSLNQNPHQYSQQALFIFYAIIENLRLAIVIS